MKSSLRPDIHREQVKLDGVAECVEDHGALIEDLLVGARTFTIDHVAAGSERETTITSTDDDDTVRIWTNQKRYIGRMRRHPSFTETGTGFDGTTEWASFEIPADQWNPATGAKRNVVMSDERKAELAERFRVSREQKARAAGWAEGAA